MTEPNSILMMTLFQEEICTPSGTSVKYDSLSLLTLLLHSHRCGSNIFRLGPVYGRFSKLWKAETTFLLFTSS